MFSNINKTFELANSDIPSTSRPSDGSITIDFPTVTNGFNELVITRNRPTNVPFLSEEIRARADAEKFSLTASIVLNNYHIKTEIIVKDLLQKMFLTTIRDHDKLDLSVELAFAELIVSNNDKEGDYFQFAKTINGFEHGKGGVMTADPSWLIAMASLSWIDHRLVGFTTTVHPINMGPSHSSVQMLAIVIAPIKEKTMKRDIETSRNIAAIMSDPEFRQTIRGYDVTETTFRDAFKETAVRLQNSKPKSDNSEGEHEEHSGLHNKVSLGRGIYKDFRGRLPHYWSDYKDAFMDKNSIFKTITTIFVLFFSNLLPTIAFGMLNEYGTNHKINVASGLLAQLIGGVGFALFGGQPMIIMLTTSPLSLLIAAFYTMNSSLGYKFLQFYTWIGIFNAVYLFVYSFTGFSMIMKFSRRSTEETFELFVSVTFVIDSVKACTKSFHNYYYGGHCVNATIAVTGSCTKEESLLFVLLLLGTMALGLWLNGLTETPFLNSMSRKMLSEFALPVSVLFMSFIGSYVFKEVKIHSFTAPPWRNISMIATDIRELPIAGIMLAAAVAFPLSILFFMEQNIASSIVNCPLNKLKKGPAYHYDLLVVGIINLILSIFGLPWVHGALPHSPMHVTALATIEEHIDEGNKIDQKVVKVTETRIPVIIANILIGCCIFLMPYPLLYIPAPVLNGLFLYMAFTALHSNQLFERLLLFITEQSAYPPNHYLISEMNRNSEVPLVAADAFVMYYDNLLGKWVASGASKSVTVAKVQLLQHLTTNQFRIFAWNPINKEILVSSILYYNLRYQKAHATFHEWRDADTQLVYGLHFADAKEAHMFGDVISKVFQSLELIYQQCRELQAVIRANTPGDQYGSKSQNLKIDIQPNFNTNLTSNSVLCEMKSNEHFTTSPPVNIAPFKPIQKSIFLSNYSPNPTSEHSISFGSSPSNNFDFNNTHIDLDTQDLPNYENINNILLKHSEMKSLSIGSENLEFSSNRCQSSSDDSVRGLKRQPSSASSGYATVASIADQYSPTPGLTSSFAMVAEALNKSICDSKSQVQSYLDYSNSDTVHESNVQIDEPVQSAFASQLQNLIQLRKQSNNPGLTKQDSIGNFNRRPEVNQKYCDATVEAVTNNKDVQTYSSPKVKPVDDIMSEMRIKLQRRKQLIDGHTDPNYSSSTEKSDVCSSSASDAGSFVSNADNSIDNKINSIKLSSTLDTQFGRNVAFDSIKSNKVLLEDDEKSSHLLEEMRDTPKNMNRLKKRSAGDIMQITTSSSMLASKDDLNRIKQEITNDFRRELLGVKKEVVDAIRFHQNVSS